jgi:hypothetical protein
MQPFATLIGGEPLKGKIMKNFIKPLLAALFPPYDPTRTNLAGAIAVGIAILLISQYAH